MNQTTQPTNGKPSKPSKSAAVPLAILLGLLMSGCQTITKEPLSGDFRFREVPTDKASYTVVVESLSGIVDLHDYEAMEQLVVREFNQAGLPAIRMFESGETTHYLYVFLQRTDDVLTDVITENPENQRSDSPQHWAAANPRYLRGNGLQTPSVLLSEHRRHHLQHKSSDPGHQLAGKLSVLFAVFKREELDSLILDNPNPEPQLDGMFLADLQEDFLTSEALRSIASTTAQRILEARTDPQAAIAATNEHHSRELKQMDDLRPAPFTEPTAPALLLSQHEETME